MSTRTELPKNFLQKGLFLKEDEEFLKGITSGTVKCKRLSKEHAIAWLGKPGQNAPEVPEKFCDDFLDLFQNIRDDILCLHSYVIGSFESMNRETAKTRRDIHARGTKIITEQKDHRFLVTMFCHKGHWFWVVVDALQNKVYWGDTLYDKLTVPDPLVIFMWHYSTARQAALGLIDTPKYSYEKVPSPKQKDGVSCGPMACGCLIALFLRNPLEPYPITEFDGSLSPMLRQRIVLSIARGTLLTEIDQIVENITEKYDNNVQVLSVPILNIEQPTEIFQSLQTQKVIDSIEPVFDTKLDFCLDGIISNPLYGFPAPSKPYTEVTILVDFKMDPYYVFKTLSERIVLAVAALTTIVKSDEKKTTIRATTDRVFEFINSNQYNPTLYQQEFNQAMQALRYYPDYTKVPKDLRAIKKQRTNGEKFWVLTKQGFETYIKTNPACRCSDVKRQQGRKTISTKKKDLLMLEDSTPSPSKITSCVPWITLVYEVVCQQERPFTLDEVVKRMPQFKVDGYMHSYADLPKKIQKSIRVAVRQGITTGATERARRPRRFYSFTQKPKIGKKLPILYVGLIEYEGFKGQCVESATSIFEWKQFSQNGSPDFRLYCSTHNQQKILYSSPNSGGWLDNTQPKLLTKKLIHQGTLFQIPHPENQWIMYNAERAIEYFNITRFVIGEIEYGYAVATIPENGTIVLQG